MGAEFQKTLIVDGVGGGSDLVTNGDFDTDTDWTKGIGWSISSGAASHSSGYEGSIIEQSFTMTQGTKYTIKYEVTSAPGAATFELRGSFNNETLSFTEGEHEYVFQCANGNNTLSFYIGDYTDISIDNVSVRETGVDDTYSSIKSAVDDLITAGNGGVDIVEEGTYEIEGIGEKTTIDVPSDITIIGRGNAVLSVTVNVPLFKNDDFGTASKSRIIISGFKIHVNMTSGDYENHLIHFKGVKNSVLEKLTISAESEDVGSSYAAIKLEGVKHPGLPEYYPCSGNVIKDCNIQNFEYGILLAGYNSSYPNCEENMIQNNTVSDNTSSNIELSYAPYNVISNNILSDAGDHGLYISNESNFSCITGNEVIDNSDEGIYIKESNSGTLQGNVCKSNGGSGIRLEGSSGKEVKYCSISGNTCCNNSADGIKIQIYSDHNVIIGNTCTENSVAGINENYANVDYNLFVGNIVWDNTQYSLVVSAANSNKPNNITD